MAQSYSTFSYDGKDFTATSITVSSGTVYKTTVAPNRYVIDGGESSPIVKGYCLADGSPIDYWRIENGSMKATLFNSSASSSVSSINASRNDVLDIYDLSQTKSITINPSPADADVYFIVDGNEVKAIEDSEVTYEVSKEGYNTNTNTIIMDSDKTIDVELEEYEQTFSLNISNPSDLGSPYRAILKNSLGEKIPYSDNTTLNLPSGIYEFEQLIIGNPIMSGWGVFEYTVSPSSNIESIISSEYQPYISKLTINLISDTNVTLKWGYGKTTIG